MAAPLSITWLGHSTFLIGLPSGKRVVTDPWLGNPNCPASFSKPESLKPVDAILVSHGHSDHLTDVVPLARATGAAVVCIFELGEYLREKGLQNVQDMGIGGTQRVAGLSITMTQAVHSGSTKDGGRIVYLGGAAGFILRAPDLPTIYFAGDTGLFGDMKLIGDFHKPDLVMMPIGGHFVMGPKEAALATKEYLKPKYVLPMHYGTSPQLAGTTAQYQEALGTTPTKVFPISPGEKVEF